MKELLKFADGFYKMSKVSLNKKLLSSLNYDDKIQYLNDAGFIFIDKGNARKVFIINSHKAIKVSNLKYEGGEQNKTEYSILKIINSPILPKVYDHAPDFSWIEVELVRPLKSEEEFEQLSKIKYSDFFRILYMAKHHNKSLIETVSYFSKLNNEYEGYSNYINNYFFKEIDLLCLKFNIWLDDIFKIKNLGKNSNGKLVILDIGLLNNT